MKRAVALLSGGMDSVTAAAIAQEEGFEVHALALDYGQRAIPELECACRLSAALDFASFRVVKVDLGALGGSALTDDIDVPKDRSDDEITAGIPASYVPARNTVFLSLALACAETLDADAIVIGVNALDYSGYPDCRPEYIEAFQAVAALGTKRGVEGRPIEVRAPLVSFSKADIVRRGVELGVPFGHSLSCYEPIEQGTNWSHCGRCDACKLRARGFAEAGVADPAAAPSS